MISNNVLVSFGFVLLSSIVIIVVGGGLGKELIAGIVNRVISFFECIESLLDSFIYTCIHVLVHLFENGWNIRKACEPSTVA